MGKTIKRIREGMTKYRMSQDICRISSFVLPSYFIKKKTSKEVKGSDFRRAPATGVFSESFVTVAMMTAEIRILIKKYIPIPHKQNDGYSPSRPKRSALIT